MDEIPVPKPRSAALNQSDQIKRPVPLPRTKLPANNERVSASDLFRSITTVSKQITEDVANRVSNSAKTANEKIENAFIDGSKFAKGTLEKTINTSKAMKDSVTKSVIESTKTAGLRLRRSKRFDSIGEGTNQRCTSLPIVDVRLFDNLQFHSPLLEQKRYRQDGETSQGDCIPSLNLHSSQLDELSLFSSNSDSNTDTVSNFSFDCRDNENNQSGNTIIVPDNEQITYDTPKPSKENSMTSINSTPEVPERRKKKEKKEILRENSLYENWTLPDETKLQEESNSCNISKSRPSKSTIIEFDPLNSAKSTYEGVSNELLLLESFLIGDTYGTIVANENSEDCIGDFVESEYFNPPTPPERSDSLFPSETDTKPCGKDTNSNWFINESDSQLPVGVDTKSSVMQRFSHILKRDKINAKTKLNNAKISTVEKPPICGMPVPYFSGTLTKVVSGAVEDLFKNSTSRFCVLSDQKIMCYTDPTNSALKEVYPMDSIYSVQIVLPLSSSTTGNSYCFELNVASGGIRSMPRRILFSCFSAPERRNWAQKIAQHLTSGFPSKYTTEFTRCGWCYLKEGVSGEWRGAWVMLVRRILVYYTTEDPTLNIVDLRKTRCVVTQEADEETKTLCPDDGSGNLLLDCPHVTLYLRFVHEKELKGWRYMVKLAAHNNGAHIHHQQLTKDDVPTIVDKCLSYIYAHGSLTEGIYRRAGSSSVLSELLGRFRRDAWSVQLVPGEHSEHDVAGVLKRFFRDLPEPLLPQDRHEQLVAALLIEEEERRHAALRNIVTSLPLVARNTVRKLFAHLHFLQSMAAANKMSAENLASVWAPTIMPAALISNTLQMAWSSKEVYVVRDLILHYEAIWEPTEAEQLREDAVRRVLIRVMGNSAPATPKAAGDLRVWVYVKDRNTCAQVALTPHKTSADLCIELCEKSGMDSHLLMLEEVVCNESMRRIVNVDEIVLDVVLRWSYWDEDDRKDNYLLVKDNKVLYEIEVLRKNLSSVSGELRYANESTKSFKTHMFECQISKLCYFKDKQGSQKIDEWDIKDFLWYTGHEAKRNPQTLWAITFISKKNKSKRSKEKPWFGHTVAGAVTEEQLKWMGALMLGEHDVILPTPRLVIT